jgi:hypothetical protein
VEERNSHPQKDEPRRREPGRKNQFQGRLEGGGHPGPCGGEEMDPPRNILEEEKAPAWKRAKIAQ